MAAGRGALRTRGRRLIRFGFAGCVGFAVDFGGLIALHSGLGIPLVPSTLVAYSVGAGVHYSLLRYWVFPHRSTDSEVGKVARYLLLGAFNALATVIIVSGLASLGVDYRLAKAVAVVILFFTNYVLTPRFVMTSPRRRAAAPATDAISRSTR